MSILDDSGGLMWTSTAKFNVTVNKMARIVYAVHVLRQKLRNSPSEDYKPNNVIYDWVFLIME